MTTTRRSFSFTKMEARQWLDANVGQTLVTVQYNGSEDNIWRPGPRILVRKGKTKFAMRRITEDGTGHDSWLSDLTGSHIQILSVTGQELAFRNIDSGQVTVYTLVD